jgi:hypothetical protein
MNVDILCFEEVGICCLFLLLNSRGVSMLRAYVLWQDRESVVRKW